VDIERDDPVAILEHGKIAEAAARAQLQSAIVESRRRAKSLLHQLRGGDVDRQDRLSKLRCDGNEQRSADAPRSGRCVRLDRRDSPAQRRWRRRRAAARCGTLLDPPSKASSPSSVPMIASPVSKSRIQIASSDSSSSVRVSSRPLAGSMTTRAGRPDSASGLMTSPGAGCVRPASAMPQSFQPIS
jgi:hypothetical protein